VKKEISPLTMGVILAVVLIVIGVVGYFVFFHKPSAQLSAADKAKLEKAFPGAKVVGGN
jgi:heme/copper-type cytochrome/quinol oxidase subunit 2